MSAISGLHTTTTAATSRTTIVAAIVNVIVSASSQHATAPGAGIAIAIAIVGGIGIASHDSELREAAKPTAARGLRIRRPTIPWPSAGCDAIRAAAVLVTSTAIDIAMAKATVDERW